MTMATPPGGGPEADRGQGGQPVRILIVDDRPENLLALETILEAPERTLVLVRSGREALRQLLRQQFALVLLDVNMPDMDGFETAQLIRQRPASAHTPIIFITAQHDALLATRSYALGAVDYISTPVNPEILRAKAAVFVELFRKTEENRRQAEQLRLAEERLRLQAEEKLRQADERLRLIVESLTNYALFSLDTEGCIATWNAGAERLFGHVGEEAIGREWVELLAPEESGVAVGALDGSGWREARRGERAEVEGWFERKGGERFFGRGIIAPIVRAGTLRGYSCVVHDATERKQAEEALERQARELQEANRLKDEFLAVLSHELRTPLNAIIGWTHLLRTDRLDPHVARDALDAIARNGDAQLALINDILDVSRFVAGKLRLSLAPVDMRHACRAAVDTTLLAAQAKGVQLRLDLGDGPLVVNGDADRLQQVVWNLVSNAVKFTPPGGHVEVACGHRNGEVLLSVADDGIGIPPSFVAHVFDRFRQADSSSVRRHGGLGLGLSIVRHLVELHGGTVRAESGGEGRGAAFHVALPARETTAAPVPPPSTDAPDPAPTAVFDEEGADSEVPLTVPGIRCLVVDDDADARDMLKATLERRGMLVTTASSVRDALSQVASAQFLLADIGMPDEDGYSLMREVRRLPAERGGRIPSIAVTAYASQRDRQRALEAGFDRHLAKPVRHAELLRTVLELLKDATAPPEGGTAQA